jgi:phage tail sheath gpL-like
VVIARNATATVVATAATAAIDADIKFLATSTGAVITITDTEIGSRANATTGTTGWAVPVETRAGSNNAPIYLKSASTSQLMVAVAPK